MSKKKEDRLQLAEERINSYARQLRGTKTGGLYYRTVLCKLEEWVCIRKGLKLLKDMGEL